MCPDGEDGGEAAGLAGPGSAGVCAERLLGGEVGGGAPKAVPSSLSPAPDGLRAGHEPGVASSAHVVPPSLALLHGRVTVMVTSRSWSRQSWSRPMRRGWCFCRLAFRLSVPCPSPERWRCSVGNAASPPGCCACAGSHIEHGRLLPRVAGPPLSQGSGHVSLLRRVRRLRLARPHSLSEARVDRVISFSVPWSRVPAAVPRVAGRSDRALAPRCGPTVRSREGRRGVPSPGPWASRELGAPSVGRAWPGVLRKPKPVCPQVLPVPTGDRGADGGAMPHPEAAAAGPPVPDPQQGGVLRQPLPARVLGPVPGRALPQTGVSWRVRV